MLRTKWVSGAVTALAVLLVAGAAAARPLSVEVWTDRGDDAVYKPGENMQVKARTNDDAYLLVYQIDSEGAITVLYPFRRAPGMVESGQTQFMPPKDAPYVLTVESQVGQDYIVAIASRQPFAELPWFLRPLDPQGDALGYENRHDEQEGFDEQGRVIGDPTVAIERIRRQVLAQPDAAEDFATSYTTYYVGHEVRYPRYVCNDCHHPGYWAWWDGYDPYYTTCSVVDFRVNWNWCWGPCMWSGHVPYYYYTVRPDCPPYYRHYYDNHEHWSSWDGNQRWATLWGGPLTRYKSAPPVGYVPPTKGGDFPRGTPPGYKPPGYLPGNTVASGGGRMGVPIGRNRPDYGEKSMLPGNTTWRRTAGSTPATPGGGRASEYGGKTGQPYRVPAYDERRGTQQDRPNVKQQPSSQPPRREPASEQPRYERPRTDAPARQPARYDPPRQEQPRQEAPRYNPPRQEQPRQEQPRQEQPRQQNNGGGGNGSSGSSGKHGGRGGR
jgi:hypothetical protein